MLSVSSLTSSNADRHRWPSLMAGLFRASRAEHTLHNSGGTEALGEPVGGVRGFAVGFDGVTKVYRLGAGRRSLRDLLPPGRKTFSEGQFSALRDVSFRLERGRAIGLIGPNGAGKTTILRIIAGITVPSTGRVVVNGQVGALIALGAGFHPDLTGRENVFLNGAVLGLTRREIESRYDAIVDFSGLHVFMDTPVKRYSSGMYARLGYAVAAHVDPDILLVDEVLAVGDASFQEKCMRHMDAVRAAGRTVVMVTHSLYRVEALCDEAIWLDQGQVRQIGPAKDVVRSYLDSSDDSACATIGERSRIDQGDSYAVRVQGVEMLDALGKRVRELPFRSCVTIRIHFDARRRVVRPLFNLRILQAGVHLIEASMLIDGYGPDFIEGRGSVDCVIGELPLTPKVYDIVLFARSGDGVADIIRADTYARFRVTDEGLDKIPTKGPMALNHLRQGSPVYVEHDWHFSSRVGG